MTLVVLTPTSAFGYGSTNLRSLEVSSSLVQPCSTLVVSGAAFQPGENVIIQFRGTEVADTTEVGTDGSFSYSVLVPSQVTPGYHTVAAIGSTGDSAVTTTFVNPGGCARLDLSPDVLKPGGTTIANGNGCAPGSNVTITIDSRLIASATADAQGAFSANVTPDKSFSGEQTVKATCGANQLATLLTLEVTSRVSTPEAGAATFAVFVLLGFVLLRGQITTRIRRRRPVTKGRAPN
jgi:hypothetical protein